MTGRVTSFLILDYIEPQNASFSNYWHQRNYRTIKTTAQSAYLIFNSE
jgi:hypothetical protein